MSDKPKCKLCQQRDVFAKEMCSGCYGKEWRRQRKVEREAATTPVEHAPKQLTAGEPDVIEGEIVHETPAPPTVPETHLVATDPAGMQAAQGDLRAHLEQKLTAIEREIIEANAALNEARRNGWATAALTSARNRLVDDETYYNKVLAAVEAGYTIIPEFPVEVFAVRRDKPEQRQAQTYRDLVTPAITYLSHAAESDCPPAGAGEYRNPEPQTLDQSWENKAPGAQERGEPRWYTNITRTGRPAGPITFPSMTARSPVMRATARAMQEKVFDQVGVCLPVQKAAKGRVIRPQPRRREMNAAVGDPLVIGQVLRKSQGGKQKCTSFIIAWHLNLEEL